VYPLGFGLKFFLFGGAVLLVVAALELLVRPRDPRQVGMQRYLNMGMVRTALFVIVGVLAILVGVGVVPITVRH
jgi:hypothetical protein